MLVSSGLSGATGTQCSLADMAPHQTLASTDSVPVMAREPPSPKTCSWNLAGFVPFVRALTPNQIPHLLL